MKGKDEIKELFQKELGNYQVKVNPSLWEGVQAGINTSAAVGAGSSMGIIGKAIIGVASVAAITIGTVLIVNQNNKKDTANNQQIIQNDTVEKETVETIDLADSVSEEKKENANDKIRQTEDALNSKEEFFEEDNIDNTESDNYFENIRPFSRSETGIIENDDFDNENENSTSTTSSSQSHNSNTAGKVDSQSHLEEKVDLSDIKISIDNHSNQYVKFRADGVPSDADISWSFGDGTFDRSINPEHFYETPGRYDVVLTVEKDGTSIRKNAEIHIQVLGEIENLPNIFTPNGDGKNDEFFVTCKNIKSFQITIMDQQQNVVFSSNDTDFIWNGTDQRGNPVKEGTYVYIIIAEDESGNKINKYQHLRLER